MKINLREDSVVIEGYVNAVERNSKPLPSRTGRFIERICKGAFGNALKKNRNVLALLNHDRNKVLGETDNGSLELEEDAIGLRARLETSDPEVVRDARNGDLVGWSFGYYDTPDGVEESVEDGYPLRKVKDMDLTEVSLLNRRRTPAYDGTLAIVRSDDAVEYLGEEMITPVDVKNEVVKPIDYSYWEREINEMKMRYNPNHDAKTGRFTTSTGGGSAGGGTGETGGSGAAGGVANSGSGSASGRKYGETNTSDAVAEIKSGKSNSLEKYLDADEKLTPEREQLHKDIIDADLAGKTPTGEQPVMLMLGGGPSSGKSSVMSNQPMDKNHTLTVNPDDIKAQLPGYAEMTRQTDQAASYYHEESSALAKRLSEVAYGEGIDVLYDGTGDGSIRSVEKKINAAKEKGYKVEAKYVTVDTDEAVRRNKQRYLNAVAKGENPRLPPEDYVRECHAKVTDISVAVAPKFDHIELWDNNGERGKPVKIAEGGNGQYLKALPGQETKLVNYLKKSAGGVDSFRFLDDGQVVPVDYDRKK